MRVYKWLAIAVMIITAGSADLAADPAIPRADSIRVNINVAEVATIHVGGDVVLEGTLSEDPNATDQGATGSTPIDAVANFNYQLSLYWEPSEDWQWAVDLSQSYRGTGARGTAGYGGPLASAYDALEEVQGAIVVDAMPTEVSSTPTTIPPTFGSGSSVYYGTDENQISAGAVRVTLTHAP